MIREGDSVVLTRDLPEFGFVAGDVGTVVLVHRNAAGYEVEFMTLRGETIAVAGLCPDQIRETGWREVPHARALPP